MVIYDKRIFAKNLQRYMDANGKSRKDMCEALNISYYTFSDWVNGKKFPRIDKIEMLADYFGIEKSDLIEDKQMKEHPEEMGLLAASIMRDSKLLDMIQKFQKLSVKNKIAVIQMIDNLSE